MNGHLMEICTLNFPSNFSKKWFISMIIQIGDSLRMNKIYELLQENAVFHL